MEAKSILSKRKKIVRSSEFLYSPTKKMKIELSELFKDISFCLANCFNSREHKLKITNNGGTISAFLSKNVCFYIIKVYYSKIYENER